MLSNSCLVMRKILNKGVCNMIRRSSRLAVEFITSHQLHEPQLLKLRVPTSLGYVQDVKVFFNKFGQKPGEDGCYGLFYDAQESTRETSVFVGKFNHSTAGYRTFVIALQLNNSRKFVKRKFPSEEAVLTNFVDGQFYFWETMVYENVYNTPDCGFDGGIMYQIFPDTFHREKLPRQFQDMVVPWNTPPKWKPDPDGEYRNDQYYGGTIQGIIEKLPYIKSLGVTAIYLGPVNYGGSSNRYDTRDYGKIDPMLGTWEDLDELHKKANAMGMSLGLDLVFNHSSIHNPLVTKEPSLYKWNEHLGEIETWWNFKHLPLFNQENPRYFEYLTMWLSKYAAYCDFIRLDVADSLTDNTLRYIKENVPDKIVMGEVWKNAITGEHKDWKHRTFFDGKELDCVMNYQFPQAIYRYVRWGKADYFMQVIGEIYKLYPERALRRSPIFLTSHDIPRMPNILVNPYMKRQTTYENVWGIEQHPDWRNPDGTFDTYRFRQYSSENGVIVGEQLILANNLRRLALFLQYTLPGLPSIFAGDEAGCMGLKDPFNRQPFPWDNIDQDTFSLYQKLGNFRIKYKDVFAFADFEILICDSEKIVYRREKMMFALNITDADINIPECLKTKKVLFSMGQEDSDCTRIIKNGVLPTYSVMAAEIN